MFSHLKSIFSWRSQQTENRRRSAGNMLPIEVIDLTSDVEEVDLTNESPPVMARGHRVDFNEYICPICIMNPMEPVTTFCGHVFCKLCIMESLASGYRACPICKGSLNEDQIVRLHIF
ncbi:hypothetical protein KR026_001322 [Drosophila bipectinata]|nr:hypothetical protein KR026_001322 [Drosophila bipectinata]